MIAFSRRIAFAGVVAVGWLLGPPAVEASPSTDDGPRVLVLTEVVEGELEEPRRQELDAALRTGLARGDFAVVQGAAQPSCRVDPTAAWTPACAAQAAREAGATHAVLMSLRIERRDYSVSLQVLEADDETVTATSVQRCEVCGLAEVRDVVDNQAAAIRDRLEAMKLAQPTVMFQSLPEGAIIRIDDRVVGQTPFERVLEPGTHRVRASLDGHVDEVQNVRAVEGIRSTVTFELDPVPRTVRYRKLRAFGWVALGLGVAGVVTGPTLIAIDGKSNQLRCDGGNVDPVGNCKYLYATSEAGIATTVVGAALLATGIGIAIGTRDKKAGAKRRASGASSPRGQVWFRVGARALFVQGRW